MLVLPLKPKKRYFIDTSITSLGIFCSTDSNILLQISQLKVSERQTKTDGNPSNFLISDGKLNKKTISLFLT